MKSKELRGMALEDLQEKLAESVKGLYELRVRNTTKELENPSKISQTRRDIARIKQAIAEKQQA